MSSEILEFLELRNSRLEELLYLSKDPLLTNVCGQLDGTRSVGQVEGRQKGHNYGFSSIPGIENEKEFAESVLKSVRIQLNPIVENASHKRSLDSNEKDIQKKKMAKISGPAGGPFMPSSNNDERKLILSLKTQKEYDDEENNKFLERSISDLEILSVPDHYPTKPHNVSPLAELYYLTQTLPLVRLLPGSHKALLTENFELALLEGKIAVLYSRIEELKRQGKWSLRQPKKYNDPFLRNDEKPAKHHWSTLLQEGKWMAVDFKETRKYKLACCFEISNTITAYWNHDSSVCVKRKPIVYLDEERIAKENQSFYDKSEQDSDPKEETGQELEEQLDIPQVEEARDEQNDDIEEGKATEENLNISENAESKEEGIQIFKDANTDFSDPVTIDVEVLLAGNKASEENAESSKEEAAILEISRSAWPLNLNSNLDSMKKIDQSIIKNLPKYSAFDDASKHMSAPILHPTESPLAAVSRLLYPFEDENWYKIVLQDSIDFKKSSKSDGPPDYQKGLFGTLSQRRFNYLKPPKPPLIKNIEYRSPTIWLPQDDRYLIHSVAEFCFNWDLISEHLLSSASTLKRYESNIERRTPWQCFERYIQLNEKFQFSDMKGIYAYQAQQWLERAHRAQLTTKRRISPLGVGNESIQRGHRRLRWASMFDAIRKCMKKREITHAKLAQRNSTPVTNSSQSVSGTASSSNNVASETPSALSTSKRPSDRIPTPAELSKLKFERDKSIQEAYLNQQATRSRMMAAVAQQQKQQQTQSSGNRQISNPSSQGSSSNGVAPLQGANAKSIPSSANSNAKTPTISNNYPQQQQSQVSGFKRPTTPNGTPYTAEQIQQLLQFQKQRRLMQQQNLQNKQGTPPALVNPTQSQATTINKSLLNLHSSGPQQTQLPHQGSTLQQVPSQAGSSSTTNSRIHFAPAQVSAIINSIQTKNPELSKEQVTKLAATYLANIQQQQQSRLQQQRQLQQRQLQQLSQGPNKIGSSQQRMGLSSTQKQPQIATLTPQERNQLQMLKAAKNAQQQQLQQQLQQQQQKQQLQLLQPQLHQIPQLQILLDQLSSPLDGMSKFEYEQRKKLLIQKHQQLQRLANSNIAALGGQGSPMSSAASSASTPTGTPNFSSANLTNPDAQ
ncbi:uncharacterized protein PRCAT00000792001 [Priceomyces carsonii]|uniref:uncharacterized protein n=1 Tax=Priceomyces carsonii TaxID=28549 RepID=UPI002ED95A3C|nr:unnamed protein product [Priceomyces carsonii]